MTSSANVVTPEATFSYVNIWKARAHQDNPDSPKYGLALIIPKSADVTQLNAEYNSVLAADFPDGLPYGARPGGLLDGAVRYPNDPFYADKWILSASQDEDRFNHDNVMGADRQPIMNKSEIYSGAIGHAHVSFYGYKGGSGGIGCSLHGLLKTRDGEALGGTAPDSAAAFGQLPGVAPAGVTSAPTAPGQTPPPAAPGAPTMAPTHVMTPAANGATYEAMIAAGWTDETLVSNGMMEAPAAATPPPAAATPPPAAATPPPAAATPPPAAPAAPVAATPPPAAPVAHVMTPAANGATYEQMIGAGWTHELLVANGMLVV